MTTAVAGVWAIVFGILPFLLFMRGGKANTIDYIVLKQNKMEIKLLDKHGQTQNGDAIVYELRDIDIKYKVETRTSSDDGNRSRQTDHCIYIIHRGKTTAYKILLPERETDNFKSFVVYANVRKENINVNFLSESEMEQLLRKSKRLF